jgi:tripartite-type tricarboxylate transporter receptor subunit TctC
MKRLLLTFVTALCVFAAGLEARAQDKFPSKPIKIIVAFAPGSATDIFARLLAEHMRGFVGQNVIVENKPGAFGIVAIEEMARSRPDGHTLMLGNISTSVLTPLLYAKKFTINYDKDVTPVSRIGLLPNFFAVSTKDMAVNTLPEFIAFAKARPGKVRYASSGVGSFPHYDSEILARRAGLQMEHIPIKEGPPVIIRDMMTGDIHASFLNVATSAPMVKSGQLKALAVTTDERLPDYPNVPTMKELGFPGVGTSLWSMLYAPGATPPDVLEALHAAVTKTLNSDGLKAAYRTQNITPTPTKSLAETREWLNAQMDTWKKTIAEVKIDMEP